MNDMPNIIPDTSIYTIIKFMLVNNPKNPNATLIKTVMEMLMVIVYIIFSIIDILLRYLCTIINPVSEKIITKPNINCITDNTSIS